MKINFSLSLKLTLIVVSVSAIIIFSLTYYNIEEQTSFFENNYVDKATALARSLDASIESHNELNDTQKLQKYIKQFNNTNSELLEISINLPDEKGRLKAAVSTDVDSIGSFSNQYNNISYRESIERKEDTVIYIASHGEKSHTLTVFMPINLSGKIAGTYEMLLSMNAAYAAFDVRVRNLVMISAISLFILIFSFLYLLRRAIVKPVIAFRDAAKLIGEGNLDTEIKIESRDELGELSSAFNQMTNDLKKSREKIEKYNKTLEKLLSQKDEFIGQLGHDLKNPLTPLVGLLPMIMEQEKDPKIKQHLGVINDNVEYMRELVFKTLELAKLRSLDIKFDMQELNLLKEINDFLETQQHLLKENNIIVKNKVRDKFLVIADKLRLAEVFNNLINNAVKYTPKGRGLIIIDAKDDNDFVTISTKDNGIGMTKEQVDNIFDEFYKADKSTHERGSIGLGLSICKRIIEKHGGQIWAESSGNGKGSTFFFTLKSAIQKNN